MLCYKCDHSWNYKGKYSEGEGYITCPKCLYKIRVDKALVEGYSGQKLLTNLPKKKLLPKRLPNKIPTTILFNLSDLPEEEEEQESENELGLSPAIKIIKRDIDIRVIPYDPIKILEHQQSYGFFGF